MMTSIKPVDQILPQSPISERSATTITTSLIRFNSPSILSETISESPIESSRETPFNFSIDEKLFQSDGGCSSLISSKDKIHSKISNEIINKHTVKISEYHAPNDTPFEPLSSKISSKKLHRYILITPRTIFSMSLLTILSIAIVLIGFGIAYSYRQSQLHSQCLSIEYCPKNISYTILCNLTNELCECYDYEDKIIGCFKQRKYNEGCYRLQECSINQNLKCNLNKYQCQCLDHYYFNGSLCIPMLTYNETCSLLNDTCDYLLNLKCLSENICTCNTNNTFWNGEYCENYRSIDEPCDPYKTPSGCSMTFFCENSSETCQCSSLSYFDGEVCLKYSSYLEPCYDTLSCLPNSQLICLWGLCLCDDIYFYWSSLTSTCVYPKQITYNSTCEYQTTCESDFGLRCINGRCLCEINSYWTPGNYCDVQSLYNEQCLTAPCLDNTGLLCSANICTCPQYYYWDNYICQYQRTYTGFCLADNWCRLDLGLRCRNFQCTCSLCTTCFWDGVRCRDCPTSWQIVISNGTIQPRIYCYLKVDSYVNWNESLIYCSIAATSFFGPTSHLIYIDDIQEIHDVSIFATNEYYDVFIGHTNEYNFTQWSLSNGTLSPPIQWCTGVTTNFPYTTCTRLLISDVCVTDIACNGWTSRYICELD